MSKQDIKIYKSKEEVKNDLLNGKITKEEAIEIGEEFFLYNKTEVSFDEKNRKVI